MIVLFCLFQVPSTTKLFLLHLLCFFVSMSLPLSLAVSTMDGESIVLTGKDYHTLFHECTIVCWITKYTYLCQCIRVRRIAHR